MDDTVRKKEMFQEIQRVYLNAVANIENILRKYSDIHFYEDSHGWDDTPDPITGNINRSMDGADLLNWIYENTNEKYKVYPYMWTDNEIMRYRNNRNLAKVDSWKQSIQYMKKKIKEYDKKIKETLENVQD